jgi:Tol biopolymer transport system component
MKSMWKMLGLTAAVAVGAMACEPFDIDDGGGGTAGSAFSRGFVFVREGDRNVYALDDNGNPNSPLVLTQHGGVYQPAVSRGGQLVAYVYKSGSTFELRTVPTTGQGQPSTVVSSATLTGCTGCTGFSYPTFSPDGRTIVFTLSQNNRTLLARVGTDASGFRLLTSGSSYVFGPSTFMPDGRSVLAAGGSSASQHNLLLQVNVDSGAQSVASFSLGNEALSVVSRVAVSPDGTKVAFDGRVSNGGSRIFVGQFSGQQVQSFTQVTGDSSSGTYPSWRSNTELGFVADDGGYDNVYRISATSVRGSGNLTMAVPGGLEPSYGGF